MTSRLPPPFEEPRYERTRDTRRTGLPQAEYPDLPADIPFSVKPDPDAPDDYEPLPDGMQQEDHVTETIQVVRTFFWGRPGVLVSGNTPVYYHDEQGQQRIFRPDCYVAFGVNPVAIRRRNGYFIRDVGRPPDFALEIASVSTFGNDLGLKRDLYAWLGIGEYWRFDATGDFYPEPLAGERLVDGEYRAIEPNRDADGVIRGYSPTLGLDLCWDGGHLRFLDPATGAYLRNLPEAEATIEAQQTARHNAEIRAATAEAHTNVEAAARRNAEAALQREQAAREADQARIRQLEEELRRRGTPLY